MFYEIEFKNHELKDAENLEELLSKPAQVVLDATPCVGGDEVYPDQKYFNNPVLPLKVWAIS